MIARLLTWLFYAVVFFLLGVWIGGFSPGLRALLKDGVEQAQIAGEDLYRWADQTIGKSTPPTPDPTSAASVSTPEATVDAARAAFARGDVSQAISLYQALLTDHPADVDARGELGNVYFAAGRLQEAGQAYYETAVRLARSGDMPRAKALTATVRRADPALADKLDGELKALGAPRKPSAESSPSRFAAWRSAMG